MAGPLIDTKAGAAMGGLAADSHSLDQLRRAAQTDPAKAVKEVSRQFEAVFMQQVLKSMREATPKSGMFDSSEQDTYTSMLDEQLAQKIAQGGTGLAAVIERQLSRNLPQAGGSSGVSGSVSSGPAGGAAATAPVGASASVSGSAMDAAGASSPSSVLQNIRAAAGVRSSK